MTQPTLHAFFDGACEPQNPGGHGASAFILMQDGIKLLERKLYLGQTPEMTNNIAEYIAVGMAVEEISQRTEPAVIYGDSQLVIKQLSGKWGARSGAYLPYYNIVIAALQPLKNRVSFKWIPREDNYPADELTKVSLAENGILPRIKKG